MRRAAPLAAVLVLLAAGPAPAAKPQPSWAQAEIGAVVARGLMASDTASFRPDDPLAQGELAELVAGLTGKPAPAVTRPHAPVSLVGLNAQLVRALGLGEAAAAFARSARSAGLAPPDRFGTEVVARLLGLRTNHPAAQDRLELLPADPATRAEAAYSAARILRLRKGELDGIRAATASFSPPTFDEWQRRILTSAVAFVGFPYVWGGESERAEGRSWPFGAQVQGGFDCSGFIWRVYKLQVHPEAVGLGDVVRGRTTFELAAETPRAARIPFDRIAPGDLLFFGARGPRSQPAQVDHVAIYAGSGWMVHSSVHGVTLAPLSDWFRKSFAWARRPLAEAGLVAPPPVGR